MEKWLTSQSSGRRTGAADFKRYVAEHLQATHINKIIAQGIIADMKINRNIIINTLIGTLAVFAISVALDGTDTVWVITGVYFTCSLLYLSTKSSESEIIFLKLFQEKNSSKISAQMLEAKKLLDCEVLTKSEYEQKIEKLKKTYLN